MGFLGQGIDKQGRHVISYGRDDYEEDMKSTPVDDTVKIGPLKKRDKEGNYRTLMQLFALIQRNSSTQKHALRNGMNHTYPLDGELRNTLNEPLVYLDGSTMDESDYTIDFFNKTITIHKDVTQVNDDIDVRFAPDMNKFYLIEDLLILPTCSVITEADLHLYVPRFYDKINIRRIATYNVNKREAFANLMGAYTFEGHGYVMDYRLTPEGIYATLKIVRQK